MDSSTPTAQELIELKGVEPELAATLVRELTAAGYLTSPAISPFVGAKPEAGDLIHVARTSKETYEGFWEPVEEEQHGLSNSGHSAIIRKDGVWQRLRDQGATDFGRLDGGYYTESDTIEVIERRHGEPFEHLLDNWVDPNSVPEPKETLFKRFGRLLTTNASDRL